MVNVKQIDRLLKKHFVIQGDHVIDPNTGVVDVTGNVILTDARLPTPEIPVQFGVVTGDFWCRKKGLVNLKGAPTWVGGQFMCQSNKLQNLAHAPNHVGSSMHCSQNWLSTLTGAPDHVGGSFVCHLNHIKNLEGAPKHISNRLVATMCPLENLQGIPDGLSELELSWDEELSLLRALTAQQIKLDGAPTQVKEIMDKYAGQGKSGALNCALELKKAGFEGNARW